MQNKSYKIRYTDKNGQYQEETIKATSDKMAQETLKLENKVEEIISVIPLLKVKLESK